MKQNKGKAFSISGAFLGVTLGAIIAAASHGLLIMSPILLGALYGWLGGDYFARLRNDRENTAKRTKAFIAAMTPLTWFLTAMSLMWTVCGLISVLSGEALPSPFCFALGALHGWFATRNHDRTTRNSRSA